MLKGIGISLVALGRVVIPSSLAAKKIFFRQNLCFLEEYFRNQYSEKKLRFLFFCFFIFNNTLLLQWNTVKIYIKRSAMFVSPEFFKGFVFNHTGQGKCEIRMSHKKCVLKNDMAVKFVRRLGLINKTILSKNNESLFVENHYIGKENYKPYKGVMYNDCPKRKIINGTNFNTYLFASKDKKAILKRFYNWLFEEFKTPDKNKVKGIIVDCHFLNFIVDDNEKFHFIDKDVTLKQSIDKSYILYRSLKEPGLLDLYKYFLKYYKIKDKSSYYIKHRLLPLPQNNKNLKKAEQLNAVLLSSFFDK